MMRMSKQNSNRLDAEFFSGTALDMAPKLLGSKIFRRFLDGSVKSFTITEVEAYMGENDKANHASKGKTPRTQVMFKAGGYIYVYLVYGMHWMFNIVTGGEGSPEAILLRGVSGCSGPGRLTRMLEIDSRLNGMHLSDLKDLWIEKAQQKISYSAGPRIGVDYAGEYWSKIPWRFWINPQEY